MCNLYQVETWRVAPLDQTTNVEFEPASWTFSDSEIFALMAAVTLGTFAALVAAYELLF